MKTKLYALVLEDIQKDADILQELLTLEDFDLTMDVVETEKDFISSLEQKEYDIIFADYTLPSFNGQDALELAKKISPNIPFIFISGTIGEDRAVELLKQGATDYVLKDRMERVAFATKRALDASKQLLKFRLTEIELQTNRKLLQTIINNAVDAIYIKDIKGRYLLFNRAAEKAVGKPESAVIGKDDNFIFPSSDAQMTMEIDRKVIGSKVPMTSEEAYTLADGKLHFFQTIKCPMFDDNGHVNGLFGISRDITELKQMELNLIEAKEKAEESDRLKTAFLRNISHEIRTPMNAIVGFSSLLNEPGLVPEVSKHYTEILTQSSDKLLTIISDIISIATIEAGQEKVNEKEVDLNALIHNLYDKFLPIAEERTINLSLKPVLPEKGIFILTDETKLKQVLTNLISNALKFTREGNVCFGYSVKDNMIEFVVEDTGIGIPSNMHSEIFERFRQVEITTARQYGGSGLGLSISKACIELLGGKIWLKSELMKGSTFFFTIPVKKAAKHIIPEIISVNEQNPEISKTFNLLIAEDEDSNFMLMEVMLSRLNLNILRAIDGKEAVDICKSNKPIDLVLMDLKMPVMDGLEATRQIKKLLPDIPIIAQTAYSTEEDKHKALASGCNDFISKPFKRELLISKVKEQLYKR